MKSWKTVVASLVLAGVAGAEIVERAVARVNGDIVTLSEFEARQVAAVQAARVPQTQIESYLRANNLKILQEAIDDLLLVQRAGEIGIRMRPEYIQQIIDGIKKDNNIADDAELRAQLRREGLTLDDLKRNILRSVLRREVLQRELEGKTGATEADARAYYEGHRQEFTRSAAVHLQEIVVPDEAAARDLVRRARSGEDFAELARAHSTSGSRAGGGDLGRVSRGDMAPELESAVDALEAGGVSEPLPMGASWRIVRVVAKDEAKVTPFAEVKDEVLRKLAQDRMSKAYEEYMEGLRKGALIRTMVSEVPLQIDVPAVAGPGSQSIGASGAPEAVPSPRALTPALPGIDASEIGTTGSTGPERVAPPAPPQPATPSPSPSPSPSPVPSPRS
jgi:parvulin-like peptidyl-prolyl isomerase